MHDQWRDSRGTSHTRCVKRIELPLGVRNFPILCKVSEDFLDEQSEKDPYNASVLFEDRNISLPQAH